MRVTISLPRGLAAQLEKLRRSEHRTRSGLLQEALRAYLKVRSAPTQPLKPKPAPARTNRARTPGADPRLHERMAARMLEQSRLSQGLIELRDAMARKRAAGSTT